MFIEKNCENQLCHPFLSVVPSLFELMKTRSTFRTKTAYLNQDPEVIKTFMLSSAEHEIFPAYKF